MRILYIEPFNSGSHARFTRTLTSGIRADWTVLALDGLHWKWRMRGAAAYLATRHADALARPHDLLLASSYLPLAELRGLVPALCRVPSVLYFHENQLAYPVRMPLPDDRDLHFGFTQLVSAFAATRCVFNSRYNMESFLVSARRLLDRMPDARPKRMVQSIRERSSVLPVPLDLPEPGPEPCRDTPRGPERKKGPVILWNHRWEYDKNPDGFFTALDFLERRSVPFRVMVCGRRFKQAPGVFERARARLGDRVVHWGYAETRKEYEALLGRAHIAVSTADQEFFGVSMLEAVHFGARPLVPDRLSYVEIFPDRYRYPDRSSGNDRRDPPESDPSGPPGEPADRLYRLCTGWIKGELDLKKNRTSLTSPYLAQTLLPRYAALLEQATDLGSDG